MITREFQVAGVFYDSWPWDMLSIDASRLPGLDSDVPFALGA
jgi:hypothetical protein